MSLDKGKNKEEPIWIDDTDSETEFFARKPIIRRRPKPPKKVSRSPSPEYVGSSDSEGGKRRRKAKPKKKPAAIWPPLEIQERRRRGASEERARSRSALPVAEGSSPIAVAVPEPVEENVELLIEPPPDVDPELQRQLQEEFMKGLAAEPVLDDVDSSPPPHDRDLGPVVALTVNMIADPDKKKAASEKAIQAYEKPRVIYIAQGDTLNRVLEAVADRVMKTPDELMLVFEGTRIYSTYQTLADLGISSKATMEGYEKSVWAKIQERRREEVFRASPTPGSPEREPTPEPLETQVEDKVRLSLRGPEGEVRFSATSGTLAETICKYYCSKLGLAEERAAQMRLSFDGEVFDGKSSVADMALESGDLVDVVQA